MNRLTHQNRLLCGFQIRKTEKALLAWFDRHKRDLPWRKSRDPYLIWVSEIMLQQTQVSTVRPYFERWIRKYPNISELARASEDEVLKAWEGLGYYSRARNLVTGARYVIKNHAGRLPQNSHDLRQVPGIGRYTAGAIASIAFGQPEPALDGNVMRVLCRLWDLKGDPRRAPLLEVLWWLARQLVTDTDAARLNESLMELGALVCTPQTPKCSGCPLRGQCLAFQNGRVERPQVARRPSELRKKVQIVLARRGSSQVLLLKQDRSAAHWANLWTFPYFEVTATDRGFSKARDWLTTQIECKTSEGALVSEGKYSVTRYRIAFVAVEMRVTLPHSQPLPPDYVWAHYNQLHRLAMPAPHRRLANEHFGRASGSPKILG